MEDAQSFFYSEAAAHARNLPMRQSVLFLNGLLLSCQDNPATDRLRSVFIALSSSDTQLELIQTGQLKFDFSVPQRPTKGTKP